jgi:hypothetical protein
MNTYTNTTVNEKEINKQETNIKSRWARFLCEVNINGKVRRQWTSDLIEHIETCNNNGWQIEKVTWFVAPHVKEIPANQTLYNNR